MRKLILVAAAVAALSALGGGVAMADDPATACSGGAWQAVQTEHGTTFHSERDCAAYVKKGRVLYRPQVTVTTFCSPEIALFVTGLHPNSPTVLRIEGGYFASTGTDTKPSQPTDSQGFVAVQPVIVVTSPHGIVSIRVTDAQGVWVTGTATFTC